MVEWLVICVATWRYAAGSPLHALRAPYDFETDFSDSSNIEMLIPLLFGKQIQPRVSPPSLKYHQPALEYQQPALQYQPPGLEYQASAVEYQPPALEYRQHTLQYQQPASEPFSGIPSETFILDEQPLFADEKSRSIKKDLSRDMSDNLPISIYIHEHRDNEEMARDPYHKPKDLSRFMAEDMPVLFLHQHSGDEDLAKETINKPKDLSRDMTDTVLFLHEDSNRDDRVRGTGNIKKNFSHDVGDNIPVSIYLQDHGDTGDRARELSRNEAAIAQHLTNEVMLYLCGDLRDVYTSRDRTESPPEELGDCRECCPHVHAPLPDGPALGAGAAAQGKGEEGRGHDSEGRGSLALFGPVGGRRDWMVIHEKFPGIMKHYIKTGKKPLNIYKPY